MLANAPVEPAFRPNRATSASTRHSSRTLHHCAPSGRSLPADDYAFGLVGGFGLRGGPACGSRIFVRLVALRMPAPTRITMPTTIHVVGTLSRYAAPASPPIRIRYPMRYVANDDMIESCVL